MTKQEGILASAALLCAAAERALQPTLEGEPKPLDRATLVELLEYILDEGDALAVHAIAGDLAVIGRLTLIKAGAGK